MKKKLTNPTVLFIVIILSIYLFQDISNYKIVISSDILNFTVYAILISGFFIYFYNVFILSNNQPQKEKEILISEPKPINRSEELVKQIDFTKIYNGSYFLRPNDNDSEEEKLNYIKFYNMRTKEYVTADDLKNKLELPEQFLEFETDLQYSDEDMTDIKKGWKFLGMNDRWFIYFDDDKLYIYRTPIPRECQYIAYFKTQGDSKHTLYKMGFNNNNSTIQDDEKNTKFWVEYLINSLLIGFRRALIAPKDVYND